MLNSNATRAEVYAAIVSHLASNQARKSSALHFLLSRLQVAFHPNSLPLLPGAESILSCYPPNPSFSRGRETLGKDASSVEEDQVSRAVAHSVARIDHLRQSFSEMMRQILEEKDQKRQAAIAGDMERIGLEWGISEARIQIVQLWFKGRRGDVAGLHVTSPVFPASSTA
ncbi:hypothetical protein HOY80DRAFT_1001906 [Tuber brumale]|nr:hypothetical protein HOY80DRAFT_1001906 [Tuber brumale]